MLYSRNLLSLSLAAAACLVAPATFAQNAGKNAGAAVRVETPVASLSKLFNQSPVVIVMDQGQVTGVITKIDVIEYMAQKLT